MDHKPAVDERFSAVDLTVWKPYRDEPTGENEKSWFIEPATGDHWLFKPNRELRSQAENRSELIASFIARELGIPAARVRLADNDSLSGCISRNVLADESNELDEGSFFISEYADDFDPKSKDNLGHSFTNIERVLDTLEPPVLAAESDLSARDWFAGYLLFDALIGNQDRHSENWAVETTPHGNRHLAPSYDHASSLGISVRHKSIAKHAASEDAIRRYSSKARAGRFEGLTKTPLVDAASLFLRASSPNARSYWTQRFTLLDMTAIASLIDDAGLSEGNRRLASGIVRYNRERILACLG